MNTVSQNGHAHANGSGSGESSTTRGTGGTIAKLIAFITDAVQQAGEELDRFELRQLTVEGGSSRVAPWPWIPGRAAREIATQAYERAQSDAAGFGGVVSYYLAYYRRGEEAHTARLSFRIQQAALDGTAPTEGPGVQGMQIQGMRHIEAMAHTYVMGAADNCDTLRHTIAMLEKTIEKQQERIERMSETHEKAIDMRADLVMQTHTREMELRREEAGSRRRDVLLGQIVANAMPIVMRKFGALLGDDGAVLLGAAAPPAAPSVPGAAAAAAAPVASGEEPITPEQTRAVFDFVASLDQNAFERVAGVLSDPQRAALYGMVSIFVNVAARADAAKSAAAEAGAGIGVKQGGSS